jgi:hypothetical protein
VRVSVMCRPPPHIVCAAFHNDGNARGNVRESAV